MFNIDQILNTLKTDENMQRTAMTGAAGLAAGLLLGRGGFGSLAKMGAVAAVGSLAYNAWRNHQAQQGRGGDVDRDRFIPPPQAGYQHEELSKTLVRAMIAASRADGHIDDAERARIMDKLKVSGLGADAAKFLEDELANPIDLDAIVAAATTEEQRVELYTASRLAIEPKSRAERGYLDLLAGRLGLADALVDHIEATVSAATV